MPVEWILETWHFGNNVDDSVDILGTNDLKFFFFFFEDVLKDYLVHSLYKYLLGPITCQIPC